MRRYRTASIRSLILLTPALLLPFDGTLAAKGTVQEADQRGLSCYAYSYAGFNHQEEKQVLTKAEKKALRQERRELRRKQAAEERAAAALENPNHADYILLGENLPRGSTVLNAISGRVPGMMISDQHITTRGPGSFYSGGSALFMVDGQEVSKDYANGLLIEDIERIEIFVGSSAAQFGSRGGNGVISIYTKYYSSTQGAQ